MSKSYYQILGVSPTADLQEIKSAYKAMAMKYHPDRNPDDPQAEEQFKLINEVYQTLSDQYKRTAYDYLLHYQSQNSTNYHYTPSQVKYHPPQAAYYASNQYHYAQADEKDPTAHIPKRTKQIIIITTFAIIAMICIGSLMLYQYAQQLQTERLFEQAEAQLKQGDKINALKNLHVILTQDNPKPEYLALRAEIWLEYHNYWRAIEDYTQLIKLPQEKKSAWYFNRGKAYFHLYQYQAALTDVDKAIRLNSSETVYFMYRAILKKRMKQKTQDICRDWKKGEKAAIKVYFQEMQGFCR